jgi:hypothetical protein
MRPTPLLQDSDAGDDGAERGGDAGAAGARTAHRRASDVRAVGRDGDEGGVSAMGGLLAIGVAAEAIGQVLAHDGLAGRVGGGIAQDGGDPPGEAGQDGLVLRSATPGAK